MLVLKRLLNWKLLKFKKGDKHINKVSSEDFGYQKYCVWPCSPFYEVYELFLVLNANFLIKNKVSFVK